MIKCGSKNRSAECWNLDLNKPIATLKCSNEITIITKIANKNYNYSNNQQIFIILDYI